MIKSYLKTALRNLLRHKGASLIKLAGLSIGMACCMLILVYVSDELHYNTFNDHYSDIYRVNFIKDGDGQFRKSAGTPSPGGPAIAQDIPQVLAVGRLLNRNGQLATRPGDGVTRDNAEVGATQNVAAPGADAIKRFEEPNIYFGDNALFDIFTIHFSEGRAVDALTRPNSIVLTSEMARKYFGDVPALGRSLVYDNTTVLQVTGVIDKLPAASDVQFDALVDYETLYTVENKPIADFIRTNWLYSPNETYVRLRPGQAPASLQTAFRQLTKKYGDERVQKAWYFSLQPMSEIHLHASDVEGNGSTNDIIYIYIFSAIALLILLIANINFINLSNAQSLTRIAEIGVRKVSGAGSRQLLWQFLGEGWLMSGMAALLALGLSTIALPLLNQLTEKHLPAAALWNLSLVPGLVALFICTGLLAGFYPALFITRWQLTSLLKGKTGTPAAGGKLVRQSLIVTQFAIAIALIIGAVVIQRQLTYLRNKPLGFDKEQVVVVPLFGKSPSPFGGKIDSALRAHMNAFENDLRSYPSVRAATVASILPGTSPVIGLVIPEGHVETENIFVPWASVDYDFIKSMGMQVIAGRDFSKAAGTDNLQAFIINESAVRTFGWKNPEEAIGKTFVRGDSQTGKRGHIIGVIKDFNFTKLDRPLQPLVMDVNVPRLNTFAIHVRPDHIPATLAVIQQRWGKYFPDKIFEYSFLDDDIGALYKAQDSLSKLVGYFAVLAIFISCIGLFSLASFMAMQRTREIGIRKVLGASVVNLIGLLFRDFFRLVILALLIASPLAWWMMNKWLHDFAYRIPLSGWIFVLTGMLAISITLITVGLQGWRAARVNPVKSLRNE
jgi:putative ABC transport system permease protein